MGKDSKIRILKMLSENLEVFFPEKKGYFLCPTCTQFIPLKEEHEITKAHIIPKVAGGKLKFYLCQKCNSTFGTKQDKWFGDMIRMLNHDKPSVFSTYIKEKYFEIDGVRVNGSWKRDKDGSFIFTRYVHLNSPEVNKLIEEKFKNRPEKISLSFPMPIIKNERLINIGLLTAGYLMWFAMFGYSWVLQKHLQTIRDQLLNPDKEIISAKYVFHVKSVDWEPSIGVIALDEDMVPFFALKGSIVVFPPRDRPNFYRDLGVSSRNIRMSDIHQIAFSKKPSYGPAIILLFENRIIVAPDQLPTSKDSTLGLQFSSESMIPTILKPVTEQEYQRLQNEKGSIVIKARVEE